MKKLRLIYFFCIVLILWMALIFSFSAQPVESSVGLSLKVGEKLSRIFIPDFREWSPDRQQQFVEGINFGIRKVAHFLEYTVLGLLWGVVVSFITSSPAVKLITGTAACALFAVGDEFHQRFVPGRSPRWQDVCIDTVGAVAGILLILLIGKLIRRNRKQKD